MTQTEPVLVLVADIPLKNMSEAAHLTLYVFASGEVTSRNTGGNFTGREYNEEYPNTASNLLKQMYTTDGNKIIPTFSQENIFTSSLHKYVRK